ncbi:MAG TPA: sigma-70 family RNA polymerase sigma factor [Sedimentisphaerales bacterium]|nr:sigma-70 family RNA polymerase sigma factor [Sedimentisphaerales bacterium]
MDEQLERLLEFLENSGPGLHAMLTRLTLREDVAEDLMQELFIRLSKSKAFEKARNRQAYARKCAINLAFDWRQRSRPNYLSLYEVRERASSGNSPLRRLIDREELEHILEAISRLRGSLRESFVMRYVQQDSYEQIAQELGKRPHQVRALCSKAMAQLRNVLNSGRSQASEKEVCDG